MSELIRPSTVLPANRRPITISTSDGLKLIGEVATPIGERKATILCFHPLPTHGGMMDSHILKKAAYRLPAMAGLEIIRFNTRGTTSEAGTSEGEFGGGDSERFDVEAAIEYAVTVAGATNLWVLGWSFGTDLALRHARDSRVKGLILLSPPLRTTQQSDLDFWAADGRPIIALIPEHDDYLKPAEAALAFASVPHITLINVDDAKHLWVGEPSVYRVLSEITKLLSPQSLPLPTEVN
ncbi:MAG: alpha/beta hydrolase [Actinobacteria bacterium]|nr:alpha/beta hydrolase [Actinomycetota bacterium]MSZ45611.1 alpha/beta hydrolase [Actinomycetota bacterium]MTA04579.1 alpha/beta hydrolase [Actinomycetota bacterium]MTA22377.1 alpha/beta hydrolase [Actinomycetota bacterium]